MGPMVVATTGLGGEAGGLCFYQQCMYSCTIIVVGIPERGAGNVHVASSARRGSEETYTSTGAEVQHRKEIRCRSTATSSMTTSPWGGVGGGGVVLEDELHLVPINAHTDSNIWMRKKTRLADWPLQRLTDMNITAVNWQVASSKWKKNHR